MAMDDILDHLLILTFYKRRLVSLMAEILSKYRCPYYLLNHLIILVRCVHVNYTISGIG